MTATIALNSDENIIVKIRKSTKAKRIIIRILKDGPELVVPEKTTIKAATEFLHSKENWVIENLTKVPTPGKNLPYVEIFGSKYYLEHSGQIRGTAYIDQDQLIISGPIESLHSRIKLFLEKKLYEFLEEKLPFYAKILNVKYKKFKIRNNETKWGSCSNTCNLSFSLKLAHLPYEVVEYVIIHELCHLIHMNHSKEFWITVASVMPDYQEKVVFLKKNSYKYR